jgi:hypothetical protein
MDDETGGATEANETTEEEVLLDELVRTVAQLGPRRFARVPLLEPDARCFPDEYVHGLEGVVVVARQLLAHLGARHLAVEVLDARDDRARGLLERHAIEVWDTSATHIVLRVTELGPAETLPIVLAYRVTSAWRRAVGLDRASDGTFRDAQDESDPEGEPLRDDLTMYATGLGVLATLGAHHYAAAGRMVGQLTETAWVHEQHGVLTARTAAFLLAIQLVVRDETPARVAAIRKHLSANAQSDLDAALDALRDQPSVLREAFGVTDALLAEDEGALDVQPLAHDPRSRVRREARALPTQPVFRVRQSHLTQDAFVGSLGGAALAIPAAWFLGPSTLVLVVCGAIAVALVGARRIYDGCSEPSCSGRIPEDADRCPACHRPVRGRITHASQRLEAEERVEREDREARAAARTRRADTATAEDGDGGRTRRRDSRS